MIVGVQKLVYAQGEMNTEVKPTMTNVSRRLFRSAGLKRWFGIVLLTFVFTAANAAPRLSTDSPLGFFTNAAAAMFARLNFRDNHGNLVTVTNIPVWPATSNNFYTPAVHRILQLTANIFECTTTNLYPCLYRPRFTSDGTNIVIRDRKSVV